MRAASAGRRSNMMRAARAVLACFFVMMGGSVATASPDEVATSISYQVMSPYCPGVTLHDCPSEKATDLRRRIAGWSEAGWSRPRILDHLENEFGASIRAVPDPETGSGLMAWLLPAIALLVGIALLALLLRRWTSRSAPAPATATDPASPIDAAGRARVHEELERYRHRSGKSS